MYRNTYVLINEENLKNNIINIKENYPEYKYYFGVVKGNAYGHGMHIVNALISGGINYLAVATLDEALEIRKYNKEIPILCFGYIHPKDYDILIDNNITLTIISYDNFKEFLNSKKKIKIHIKLNTGMNRLGIKKKSELLDIISLCEKNNILLEGIYTHYATSGVMDNIWDRQTKKFEELMKDVDLSKIPIVHGYDSLSLVKHPKKDYFNGVRLGIVMYGYSSSSQKPSGIKGVIFSIRKWIKLKGQNNSETILSNNLKLKKAFNIYSEVINLSRISKGETVGYHGKYIAKSDQIVATVSIGYADGINEYFREVKINNKKYPIVSFSMDYIMVIVDKSVKLHDKVTIIDDEVSLSKISAISGVNICNCLVNISNRIERIYKERDN